MYKHHMYGFLTVKMYFFCWRLVKNCKKKKVKKCQKRKKIPIIVGGTGLYFSTITKGISKIPDIDKKQEIK